MNTGAIVAKGIAAGVMAFFSYYLGGWDRWLEALLILIVIDYATGISAGFVNRRLSSEVGAKGVVKKLAMLFMVAAALALDRCLQTPEPGLRMVVISFLVINEALSIFENLDRLGVPIPDKFRRWVQAMNEKEDTTL